MGRRRGRGRGKGEGGEEGVRMDGSYGEKEANNLPRMVLRLWEVGQ